MQRREPLTIIVVKEFSSVYSAVSRKFGYHISMPTGGSIRRWTITIEPPAAVEDIVDCFHVEQEVPFHHTVAVWCRSYVIEGCVIHAA